MAHKPSHKGPQELRTEMKKWKADNEKSPESREFQEELEARRIEIRNAKTIATLAKIAKMEADK